MRGARPVIPVLVALALVSLAGCGPKHFVTAATLSNVTMDGALTAQQIVMTTYKAGGMTTESYKVWQTAFLKMGQADLLLNQAIRAANDQGVLRQVAALTDVLTGLIELEVPKLREAEKAVVLLALTSTKSTLTIIAAAWETPQ
jgi:hypothetical protein